MRLIDDMPASRILVSDNSTDEKALLGANPRVCVPGKRNGLLGLKGRKAHHMDGPYQVSAELVKDLLVGELFSRSYEEYQ